MRVFLTGATGFIGSIVTEELKAAGHQVTGLARSDEAAARLASWGVDVRRGEWADADGLAEGARASDGVIHCAFGTDFANYAEMGATDLRAVTAMADAMAGTGKPLVVTSGMTASTPGRPSTEADPAQTEGMGAVRGAPEDRTLAAKDRNVRGVVVRLPPCVHDRGGQGLASMMVEAARRTGVSAYLGDGANRWPTVHRRDAASLFRLGLERGAPGQRLHAVGESGVRLRDIAEAIGRKLGLPVRSLEPAEGFDHFGFIAGPMLNDMPAACAVTQQTTGWRATHPGLIEGFLGDYLD